MNDIKRAHLTREAYQTLATITPAYHDEQGKHDQKYVSERDIHGLLARMKLAAEYLFECYGTEFLTYRNPCTCLHKGSDDHGGSNGIITCMVKGCDCKYDSN